MIFNSASASTNSAPATDVVKLISKPELYNNILISTNGFLLLTSEGVYLFSNCVALKQVDLAMAIYLPKIRYEEIFKDEDYGKWIEIRGKFIGKNQARINSRHKIVDAEFLGGDSNLQCDR
jgi:hypothetical protein